MRGRGNSPIWPAGQVRSTMAGDALHNKLTTEVDKYKETLVLGWGSMQKRVWNELDTNLISKSFKWYQVDTIWNNFDDPNLAEYPLRAAIEYILTANTKSIEILWFT